MFALQNGWTKERMKEMIRMHVGSMPAFDQATGHHVYEHDDGRRCGVGAFMPYDVIARVRSTENNHNNYKTLGHIFDWISEFMPLSYDGMLEIQKIHDSFDPFYRFYLWSPSLVGVLCDWIDRNVSSGFVQQPSMHERFRDYYNHWDEGSFNKTLWIEKKETLSINTNGVNIEIGIPARSSPFGEVVGGPKSWIDDSIEWTKRMAAESPPSVAQPCWPRKCA